jgi:hypothetical protein
VRLLIERGADLHDRAFDGDGPTPLDCALWGLQNNRADDGDYPGTVQALTTCPSRPDGKRRLDEDPAVQRPEAILDPETAECLGNRNQASPNDLKPRLPRALALFGSSRPS